MGDLPLVTCVCLTMTPARLHMLPDALRSYRQQTYSPRELVVVNDGAPLRSQADDVRVVNLPDRGWQWSIGEKRNIGIRAARGDYIATWDDDDVSLPTRLAEQVEAALSRGADSVVAEDAWVADENLSPAGFCRRGQAVLASALMRRQALVDAGGYQPSSLAEDMEMQERIRYMVRGVMVTQRGAMYYVVRRHGANSWARGDGLIACAMRDPDVQAALAALASLRRGPGGEDAVQA